MAAAPKEPATLQAGKDSSEDDGDLGLQGMSLSGGASASPSPQTEGSGTFQGQRPTFGLMKLLGSVVGNPSSTMTPASPPLPTDGSQIANPKPADTEEAASSDAFSAGSYHSLRDADAIALEKDIPADEESGTASIFATQAQAGAVADTPSSELKGKKKSAKRKSKRMTKMREEIAGPISGRPLAGSSGGPPVTPRRTSMANHSQRSGESDSNMSSAAASPLASPSRLDEQDHETPVAAAGLGAGVAAAAGILKASLLPSAEIGQRSSQASSGTAAVHGETGQDAGEPIPAEKTDTPQASTATEQVHSEKLDGDRGLPGVNQSADVAHAAPSSYIPPLASPPVEEGLDEAALQRWVLSVGCVNFDLEKGPDLEFLYPSLGISREERDCIAFSSFPDTSIFDDGHAVFSWRVREVPLDSSSSDAPVIATPQSIKPTSPISSLRSRRSLGMSSPLRRLAGFEKFRALHTSEEKDGHVTSPSERNGNTFDSQISSSGQQEIGLPSESSPVDDKNSSSSSIGSLHTGSNPEMRPQVVRTGSHAEDCSYLPLSTRAASEGSHSSSTDYIHGFCFFRQKRDATIRRGYFQKSVVILSHLPYVSFFCEIVRRLGPLFFEQGMPILEAFAQDIKSWPPPEPGARLHLPLLGSVISVELPFYSQAQSSPLTELKASALIAGPEKQEEARSALRRGDGSKEDEPILASIPVTPLFEVFKEALSDMWLLWECLILAEPILVVGPDPTTCSEAVWHMLDLIKPIPFAGDFRPYFTIHDHDFKALVTKNRPSAGIIIGVTNPFMLQACSHWPHILKVGKAAVKQGMYSKTTGKKISTGTVGAGGGIAGGNSAGGGGPSHMPGLVSKRKRRISKDRALLKTLDDVASKKTGGQSANDALRLYFTDLTERFLAPLNRYVSSLIPADFSLASPSETPKIKPFNTTAFMLSLKSHGTPLPMRSRNLPTGSAVRQSLYLDFIQCPNFSTWLHARIHQSREEQYMRKLAALESGDIPKYVQTRGEVETVDLYARLRAEVNGINSKLLSGRRERELQPNSRWKPVFGQDDGANSPTDERTSLTSFGAAGASSSTNFTPLEALVRLPPTAEGAKSIRSVVNANHWQRSFTSGERILLNKKARLIDQLDRLLEALPADLRQTLLLKERQRRLDLQTKHT